MSDFDEYKRQGAPEKRELANDIHATQEYLNRFFGNLLFGESHDLKNRELRVDEAV